MSIGKPPEQTFWKVVAADIIAFDQHKNAMLNDLIKAYESGRNANAFDANKAWVDLTRVAKFYFSDRAMRQEAIIPAERVKRLNAFAKALRSARGTIGNDIDGDLLRGWIAAVGLTVDSLVVDAGVALQRETDELNKALANLVILETAARRATSTVRTQRGRPKGDSVLPPIYISELARVFLESTGLKYDASDGLFAQFVRSFLAAIRPSADKSDGYVVESIKYARKLARRNPSGSALSFL
jgi:hypothetical protein